MTESVESHPQRVSCLDVTQKYSLFAETVGVGISLPTAGQLSMVTCLPSWSVPLITELTVPSLPVLNAIYLSIAILSLDSVQKLINLFNQYPVFLFN